MVIPAEDSLPNEVELKHTVEAARNKHSGKSTFKDDVNSGLTVAMNEIPDGMACGLLAGVSPIMGLFATVGGGIVGGLFNSSRLMIVSTTSVAAFLLYQLSQAYPEAQRRGCLNFAGGFIRRYHDRHGAIKAWKPGAFCFLFCNDRLSGRYYHPYYFKPVTHSFRF